MAGRFTNRLQKAAIERYYDEFPVELPLGMFKTCSSSIEQTAPTPDDHDQLRLDLEVEGTEG